MKEKPYVKVAMYALNIIFAIIAVSHKDICG